MHANESKRSDADAELERLYQRLSALFAILGEPTRLKILNSICRGERGVGEIVHDVGSSQSNVSRHLNLMYAKGLVARRKEGAQVLYSIADANLMSLCRLACAHVAAAAGASGVSAATLRRFMDKKGTRRRP
jgi:DNA-binding transcriptional ArsR family regulator